MSEFHNYGLSIIAGDPLWYSPRSSNDITDQVTGYTHELAALGGFKSASITMKVPVAVIDEWLALGLGRHIIIYDTSGMIVWEGFVNTVSANIGTLSVSRGPMMNIANRVAVIYTPILNIDVTPPVQGTKLEGLVVDDETSQDRYGILEAVISGGSLVDDGTINESEMLRDAYIAEYRFPESSESINLQSSTEPGLTLECMGYDAFLDKYVYNNTATGSIQIPSKIQAVLAAEPNGIFSTDYTQISDAAIYLLLVNEGETESKTARSIINDLLTPGEGNNYRTLFGFYGDRIARFGAVPTGASYVHHVSDTGPRLETLSHTIVFPWQVQPGMWVFLPDFLVGQTHPVADLRGDPRFIFAETVQYSTIWGLQINGLRFGKVKQLQAKLGSGVW